MLLPLSRWSWLVKESRQSKPGRRGLVPSALVPVLMSLSDGLSPVSPRNPFLPGVDLVGVLSQQLKANWERRKGSSVREDSGQSVARGLRRSSTFSQTWDREEVGCTTKVTPRDGHSLAFLTCLGHLTKSCRSLWKIASDVKGHEVKNTSVCQAS